MSDWNNQHLFVGVSQSNQLRLDLRCSSCLVPKLPLKPPGKVCRFPSGPSQKHSPSRKEHYVHFHLFAFLYCLLLKATSFTPDYSSYSVTRRLISGPPSPQKCPRVPCQTYCTSITFDDCVVLFLGLIDCQRLEVSLLRVNINMPLWELYENAMATFWCCCSRYTMSLKWTGSHRALFTLLFAAY